MADPTRRQIAMMADEVGIIDHAAACKLVRRAFEVSRSARAALAADGPAVQSREPASVVGESIDDDAELDEPLGDLIDKWCQEGMQVKPYGTPFPLAHYVASKAYQYGLSKGHQPTPPAEGEVAELVARLRRASDGASAMGWEQDSWLLTRAADLLAQRYPQPVPALPEDATVIEPSERTILVPHQAPVPVAERPWEREGWCDEEGRCWCFFDNSSERGWQYRRPQPSFYDTHCLPHYALPLPAGEVE